MQPPTEERRQLSIADRERTLIDLLGLTDALPPVERLDLRIPTFKELCARR